MSLPRYPEYKPSGVEWLGTIPMNWDAKRLKWLLACNDGGVWGADAEGDEGTIVLRSTEQTVDGRWQLDEPARRNLTEAERASALLEPGDLLVTKSSGSALHIGKTTLVDEDVAALECCYSNFMQRIRARAIFIPKLLWYVLNNELARTQFDIESNSTTGLANLNGTIIGNLILPVPPNEDQQAIVRFLDRETAKIDALVAEQECLIAVLKEKRQAVISHAVTKGLNPDAPMKPSGIEWLGEVPAHWEIGPLKRFWSVTDCKHVTAEFIEDGYPLASIREVQSRFVVLNDAKRTTEFFYNQLVEGGRNPEPGDLIFSRNATVGEVAQVPDASEMFAMGQDVCLLRRLSDSASPDYMQFVLRTPVVAGQLDTLMIGSTFKRVNVEEIRNLLVPYPAADEQLAIVGRLLLEVGIFDELIGGGMRAVELLRERRGALISAAVTGQIDARFVINQ